MKLTLDGIKDRQAWEKAGIKLPGYILESETFSVFSSVELQTDFWKKVSWIEALPVWRPLITM